MQKFTFYTTIENQLRLDGNFGLLYDHYEDFNAALAKYYTVCAAAAVSELPYHSAAIIRSDGLTVESRVFDRRSNEPDPEVVNPDEGGNIE